MPLQWLPLDQSIYNKQRLRSPVSQALTPPQRAMPQRTTAGGGMGAMPQGESFIERERRLQEEEAKRKHELKLLDKQLEIAKFAAGLKADAEKKAGAMPTTALGQLLEAQPQAPAPAELNKENMPAAAMEMWKFISTLDPASQKFYIQRLKEKEQPKGGYIETGGKKIEMPGSLGMYGYLVDQGLLDPVTDTVIREKAEYEKGTWQYNAEDNLMINTATGETVPMKDMKGVDQKLISDAFNYGSTYMGRLTEPTLLEKITPENMSAYMDNARKESKLATMNYLLGQGVSKKEAKDIAYSIPIGEREIAKEKTIPEGEEITTEEVDETTVENLKALEKDNPGAIESNRKAYEDKYGVEEVRRALEDLSKEKEKKKTTTKTTKEEEKEEEKKSKPKETKVKDYFKKWSPL